MSYSKGWEYNPMGPVTIAPDGTEYQIKQYTCLILTNQYMFTTQEESTIAQWIEMFPTCTTADELLLKVMDHMNSFSAKMANPTNLQLAKDTLFLQLSK